MEHEVYSNVNCNWCTEKDTQSLFKGYGSLGNQRFSRDHPNYSIVKIGQNTEKSPVDLKRLAITQTPVKDDQLTLVWKTRKV